MANKSKTAIEKRQEKIKESLLEKLKETPIVEIVCKKSGISRATYYRWRKEDLEFANKADESLKEGTYLINDMAESQLMSAIKEKNMAAITFWLKHHHIAYSTKVEITAKIKNSDERLTPEQEAIVRKAIELTSNQKQLPPKNK
jgi:ACT domain-containing protein